MRQQEVTFEHERDDMTRKTGSTAWAAVQLLIPLILFTVAMALIVSGSGEGIAIGAVILAFCVYRVVRVALVWRADMTKAGKSHSS